MRTVMVKLGDYLSDLSWAAFKHGLHRIGMALGYAADAAYILSDIGR